MKVFRVAVLCALGALCLGSAASAQSKGSTTLSIQFGNGVADLVQSSRTGPPESKITYITSVPLPEIEPRLELTHMFSDDYAFNVSGALGWFSEVDKASSAATAPQNKDHRTTVSAVMFRVGGDRVVKLGSRASVYFGPGIEWWSGSTKYESSEPTETSANSTRISVSTRVGGTMWFGGSVGLTCNVGRRIGYASSSWDGAKATWWPSSTCASGGLLLAMGGK